MVKIISEIGINHNGSIEKCKELIMLSKVAGCDYAKIQKRNPDKCVPEDQKNKILRKDLLPLKITKTCRKLSFRFSKWYFYAGEQEKNCNPQFPKRKSSIRKKVIRNSRVNLLSFIPSFESLRSSFFSSKKQIPRKISIMSQTNEILSRS